MKTSQIISLNNAKAILYAKDSLEVGSGGMEERGLTVSNFKFFPRSNCFFILLYN